MKYLVSFFLLLPLFGFAQDGPISIHLKTGGIKSTRYAFLHSSAGFSKPFVRLDDRKGEKIPINQVEHIEGTDQNGVYKYFKPIKFQGAEIWGERTHSSDRVDIYYTNIVSGTWSASYTSRYFQYSKDAQPFKKLTYANLKIDLSDDLQSMVHLRKGNALRITQLSLYGLGATLVGVGIASGLSSNDGKIPPAFIAGAVCLYVPWLINKPKQNHFVNALKEYK